MWQTSRCIDCSQPPNRRGQWHISRKRQHSPFNNCCEFPEILHDVFHQKSIISYILANSLLLDKWRRLDSINHHFDQTVDLFGFLIKAENLENENGSAVLHQLSRSALPHVGCEYETGGWSILSSFFRRTPHLDLQATFSTSSWMKKRSTNFWSFDEAWVDKLFRVGKVAVWFLWSKGRWITPLYTLHISREVVICI